MATYSGTYNFNMTVDAIITESFRRIGVSGTALTAEKGLEATTSLNLILSDLANKGVNLWLRKPYMYNLGLGQSTYALPQGTVNILEMLWLTCVRLLGGTPASSSGNATFAFDGNPATSCTQNAPNGWISYNYGTTPRAVKYIGVQSNINATYTLNVQYSYDGTNWITCVTSDAQNYIAGIPTWIVNEVAVSANYYRIIETGGATLDIEELYFNTDQSSILMSEIDINAYMGISNKNSQGAPRTYTINRQINPFFYVFPTPISTTNQYLYINTEMQIYDVNALTQNVQIPYRFLEALNSNLAYRMAIKFQNELGIDAGKIQDLKESANAGFLIASREDEQDTPLNLNFSLSMFGR